MTSLALVMNDGAVATMTTAAGNVEVVDGRGGGNKSASKMSVEVVKYPRKRKSRESISQNARKIFLKRRVATQNGATCAWWLP